MIIYYKGTKRIPKGKTGLSTSLYGDEEKKNMFGSNLNLFGSGALGTGTNNTFGTDEAGSYGTGEAASYGTVGTSGGTGSDVGGGAGNAGTGDTGGGAGADGEGAGKKSGGGGGGLIGGLISAGFSIGGMIGDAATEEDQYDRFGNKKASSDDTTAAQNLLMKNYEEGGGGIGGAVNAVAGLFTMKKDIKEDRANYAMGTRANVAREKADKLKLPSSGGGSGYGFASGGQKLKVQRVMSKFDKKKHIIPRFKAGGSMHVIPKGKLHKENNNLGEKDKGIPVVDDSGQKVFELEKEELIINLETTQELEGYVAKYNETKDDAVLVQIGKRLAEEIATNTEDKSEKFVEVIE